MKISVRYALFSASIIVLLSIGGSCSLKKGKEYSERAVEQFHNQYNSEQFHEIYSQADEEFRKSGKEEDFVASLKSVRQKLGKVKQSNQTQWFAGNSPTGIMVTLTYNTEFIEGNATEQFVFRMNDNKALLYKYNVNSPPPTANPY